MQTEQNRALAEFFDDCARRGLMASFSDDDLRKVEALERLWQLAPGQRVFEPGCGSGRLTERLARAVGPAGQVVACDISPEMIQRARERVSAPNVRFHVSTVLDMGLPGASFDAVICFCALPHLADLPRTLACFRHILKPQGRLWVCHLDGRTKLNAFHRLAGTMVRLHLLPDEAGLRSLLLSAGLDLRFYHDGDDGYWALALPAAAILPDKGPRVSPAGSHLA